MPYNTEEKRIANYKKYYKKNSQRIINAHKKYREKNKERFLLQDREYYKTHKDQYNKNKRKWRLDNPEKEREQRRKYYYKNRETVLKLRKIADWNIRKKVIDYLGGKCKKCGYSSDWRALQIDHIKGGGSMEVSIRGRRIVYREILSGERKDVQLLCANCNWLKRYDNNEFAKLRPKPQ